MLHQRFAIFRRYEALPIFVLEVLFGRAEHLRPGRIDVEATPGVVGVIDADRRMMRQRGKAGRSQIGLVAGRDVDAHADDAARPTVFVLHAADAFDPSFATVGKLHAINE
ncbi:MAG: hypothetical protein QM775_07855 [Pirellulales bacterium]